MFARDGMWAGLLASLLAVAAELVGNADDYGWHDLVTSVETIAVRRGAVSRWCELAWDGSRIPPPAWQSLLMILVGVLLILFTVREFRREYRPRLAKYGYAW